ncbi:uncharacterized protein LOC141590012 [Silene latifolia]|uniref:uncharacterized protein LOC141590012 n=1 Tax=Silene latifolia TaxID=37657 RepID=UPI003D780033
MMTKKSAFEVWNYLKIEYEGDERLKGMQVLNLVREFEMQKMKESETIKEYTDKLLCIANKIRLLGSEFSNSRIVQKILVTVPERFDATISSLESSRDLSKITFAELSSALLAQEQIRLMRNEGSIEGAMQAKLHIKEGEKNKKKSSSKKSFNSRTASGSGSGSSKEFPPCNHCGKKGHPPQKNDAQVANEHEEEEQLFVASCFTSSSSSDCWLMDSSCTNLMTIDEELFKEFDKSKVYKVKIGNGEYIVVKGKGTVAIESCTGV